MEDDLLARIRNVILFSPFFLDDDRFWKFHLGNHRWRECCEGIGREVGDVRKCFEGVDRRWRISLRG